MLKIVALALLLVVAVTADIAPLLRADAPKVIPGSYMVILKDGLEIAHRDAHISQLRALIAGDAESEVGFVYGIGSMMGFSARLSPQMLKQQLSHPNVKYIEADQVVSINFEQDMAKETITQTGATWGIDRIDQRDLPLNSEYVYFATGGKGVDVYVVDTGILTTHEEFGSRAKFVFNAITTEPDEDLNGHGTHCAGTIGGTKYGVAKEVSLYAVKVLSGGGSGAWTGFVAGIDHIINNKSPTRPSVASLSLGGGVSPTADAAVAAAIEAGVHFSIAAGNSYGASACNYSPARVPGAVTVGATASDDSRASYSNTGTCLDIFAPGSSITSAWIGSDSAVNTISGTSMATPHVAGAMAVHLGEVGNLTPEFLANWLADEATPDKVTNPGTGSPNRLLFSPSSETQTIYW